MRKLRLGKRGLWTREVELSVMPDPAEWEYHAERMPDEADEINKSMELWSDAGWEFVTATSACSPVRQGNSQIWQIKYMLFWRRRRGSTAERAEPAQ
jgi:hypothetical protein